MTDGPRVSVGDGGHPGAAGQPFSAGQLVNGYQVLERLGFGGMGVVYDAIDSRLGRHVALKFLAPDLNLDDDARTALRNEARAASVLDHPNIGSIYAIEETPGGQLFIVMARYEGQTLAAKLRAGAVPVEEAASIALQIASGLAEAHAHKIVHRDIKPSNIFLCRQGLVKIVDFGLARVLESTTVTQSGRIAGTFPYMSPEQAQGKLVDARTDLWSLGVVLYEMVAGRRAFPAAEFPAALYAIVHDAPPELDDAVPVPLRRVIYHSLAKRPEDRYQSAAQLVQDLRPVVGPSDLACDATVTLSDLGKLRRLAGDPALRKRRLRWLAALPLLVVLLVWGAISIWSSRRQASAQEVYLKAEPYLQTYDRPGDLDRAIALFEESVRLGPNSALAFADLGQAYYLKYRVTNDSRFLALAETNASRAAALDSSVARVHVVMGRIRFSEGHLNLAEQEFNEALRRVPSDPDALLGIAGVYQAQGRSDQAEANYRRAADIRPDSWEGHNSLGEFLLGQRRPGDAVPEFQRVVELKSGGPAGYLNLGIAYLQQGKLEEAERNFKKVQQLDPSEYRGPANLAVLYYTRGMYSLAAETFERAHKLNAGDWRSWYDLAMSYRWLDDTVRAKAACRTALPLVAEAQARSRLDAGMMAWLAVTQAYCGEPAEALRWIAAARALLPADPDVLLDCAEAFAILGERGRAIEVEALAAANGLTHASLIQSPGVWKLRNEPEFQTPIQLKEECTCKWKIPKWLN